MHIAKMFGPSEYPWLISRQSSPNFYRTFLFTTCFSLFICLLQAQQPYSIIHYDENTLPQTTVGNIQQDENGFLWMNTQYGIVRFDGEKARVFTTSNVGALTSNRIRVCAKGGL